MSSPSPCWNTRHQAEESLLGNLRPYASAIDRGFGCIDNSVRQLESRNTAEARVIAVVLIKARNLGLSSYSLMLDGLAQEAGALVRPWIECIEVLTFFRLDKTRIALVWDGKLPKAGNIAKAIGSPFKKMREHLNTHASHISISEHSMLHLLNLKDGSFEIVQPFDEQVLRRNLCICINIMCFQLLEADLCVSGRLEGSQLTGENESLLAECTRLIEGYL